MIRRVAIGLLLVTAGAGGPSPAFAAPTFTVSGNLANKCEIGSSTSYAISIVVVKNSTYQISLDGSAGSASSGTTTITKNYTTLCNGAQTFTLTVPNTTTGSIPYTIVVKDNNSTQIATATNGHTASVAVPISNNTTWTITASSVQANGTNSGTYTATVTID